MDEDIRAYLLGNVQDRRRDFAPLVGGDHVRNLMREQKYELSHDPIDSTLSLMENRDGIRDAIMQRGQQDKLMYLPVGKELEQAMRNALRPDLDQFERPHVTRPGY